MFVDDLSVIIQWWLVILLFTITALPFTCLIFGSFDDRGYSLSRIFSFVFVSYILFCLSSFHILKNTRLSLVVCFVIFIALEFLFITLKNARTFKEPMFYFPEILRDGISIKYFVIEEIAFLILLIIWCYLRGLHPELNTTEKYMDLGYLNAILNSEYMPANDMWAAGEKINYYYFGQFIFACITKLSGINSEVTYNLSMSTLFAATFMAVFTLVFGLLKSFRDTATGNSIFGGLLASVMVCFNGNLHYLIYGIIIPKLITKGNFSNAEFLGVDDVSQYSYYFPDATRYVGYQPIVHGDRTITEFPLYSYVLSDLHAHVINLMAVVLFLAVSFIYIKRESSKDIGAEKRFEFKLNPIILLIGFLIGIFSMSNFWDYPIYLIVSVFFFAYISWNKYGLSVKTFANILYQITIVFLIRLIIALPLMLNFEKMISGIGIVQNHSKVYQLLVLWGVPLLISVIFIIWIIKNCKETRRFKDNTNENAYIRKNNNNFSIQNADIFVIILIICAIGLVFGTEILYIKDIYEQNAPRANTLFKLNYQAYLLFGISVGYAVSRITLSIRDKKHKIITLVGLLLLCVSTIIYAPYAVKTWYGGREYSGLNGINFVKSLDTGDNSSPAYDSVEWIRENIGEEDAVLEVYGDSYSQKCFVSVTTGRPTVVGWKVHEWLWRNGYDFVAARISDVDKIYCGANKDVVSSLIHKYNIDYIYVGIFEREAYGDSLNEKRIKELGHLVYNNGDIKIYEVKKSS